MARVENGGDFAHLDEKRGAAAREIVGGADAREDAVDERQARLRGGNEAADLRHEDDQRGLAKVGGLAAHVGAGDEQDVAGGIVEIEIVGDEALAALFEEFFDDGMAAGDDEQFAGVGEFGRERSRGRRRAARNSRGRRAGRRRRRFGEDARPARRSDSRISR